MQIGADAPTFQARVEAMGADGDGIARLPDGRTLFLPYTLPGEEVEARPVTRRGQNVAGIAETVLKPSEERAEPPCPHFGACGGCSLQHWRDEAIAGWKTAALRSALIQAGFPDPVVGPIETSPPGARRRVDLAIRKQAGIASIGFHQVRADAIVPIETCLVADPAILALLPPLRALVPRLVCIKRDASGVINLLDTGPDLLLRTDGEPTAGDRRLLAAFAAERGLPRIAWALKDGPIEVAAQLSPAVIHFAGAPVPVPPGAFLQATARGAGAIIAAVLAGLPPKLKPRDRIIELHAGCGTLTVPLAGRARVMAYEGDAAAVTALQKGAAAAGLHGTILAETRDLVRRPLMVAEFKDAAAVVLDPPFAGAAGQMEAIAASGVTHVIYVSCNPQALARDAAPLRRAGFTLAAATPIDQFLWSARLESVACFTRPPPARPRARPPR
ncbi:class I SAM-dependent RNA methyltransferase [Acidisoma sp. 7E03]